ncbi:hypothetical protein DXG03_001004 [Asterophora parasitica]|uniref:Uncharacterized protein n=1 Tax=Asterophora parasitica TaxID=117018 RepID=A0A9P7G9Y4_9AGAR|nr:hypothetical protein DXG03_001004 [Asterophora parasitica]
MSVLTHSSYDDTISGDKEKDRVTVVEQAPEQSVLVSEEEYKKILRKLDIHLLPFVSVLYLLSFLDRANIGNARIAGLADDLHLDGLKYNVQYLSKALAPLYLEYAFQHIDLLFKH